jgi:Uma2 family endonuclease
MERTKLQTGSTTGRALRPRQGLAVTEQEFLLIALDEYNEHWELWDGKLVRKPVMTFAHNEIAWKLGVSLYAQLDRADFTCRVNAGHARRSERNYYIPDVIVIPRAYTLPLRDRQDLLEAYAEPLPLVVEVWSRSTGRYDVREKLEQYRQRGDLEIWYIHPYDRTLTAWRQQPDGGYVEAVYTTGRIEPAALPGVSIDLDALFAG